MRKDDNFIMLPTVDFCFAGLMENARVRKGFLASVIGVSPEKIKETVLLPTILRRESGDDKLGILDVRVIMEDGTQIDIEMQVAYFAHWEKRVLFYLSRIYAGQLGKGEPYEKLKKCIHVSILDFVHFPNDTECYRTIHFRDDKTGEVYTDLMEIQILELKKLSKEVKSSEGVLAWMKFFSGKTKKEFEDMAKTNEYIGEAYHTLQKLSADEKKRLEYEAREKALRDYNSQMESAFKKGEEQGEERGEKRGEMRGIEKARKVFSLHGQGKQPGEIASLCDMTENEVELVLFGEEKELSANHE